MSLNFRDAFAVYVILHKPSPVAGGNGPIRVQAVEDPQALFKRLVRGLSPSEFHDPLRVIVQENYLNGPGTYINSANRHELHRWDDGPFQISAVGS